MAGKGGTMATATVKRNQPGAELAATDAAMAREAAATARAEAAEAKAAFDAITDRLGHGEYVSAAEYGEAELAVRLTGTRARLAGEKAAEAAEARRLAQLAEFGDYGAAELEPHAKDFATARAAVFAAAVTMFEAMQAHEERFGGLLTELRALEPLSQRIRESMYSGSNVEVPCRNGAVMLRRIDTKSTVERVMEEAYRAVFASGSPFA